MSCCVLGQAEQERILNLGLQEPRKSQPRLNEVAANVVLLAILVLWCCQLMCFVTFNI